MLYAITHRTSYEYDAPVSLSHHLAHLHPRMTARQQVLDFLFDVSPETAQAVPRRDYYDNEALFLAVEHPHHEFSVITRSRVRVQAPPWLDLAATPSWEIVRDWCASDILTPNSETGEFLFNSPYVRLDPAFAQYAAPSFPAHRPLLQAVSDFTAQIYRDFKFDAKATTISTPVEQVLEKRRGVCQDFAHLAIACLRSLGLPARYVSGYLETVPPPGKPRLVGADASHAWFATWCPGVGWVDADPTNNVFPSDRHITLAWGRDFSDVSPLRGIVVGGGEPELKVAVDVLRQPET